MNKYLRERIYNQNPWWRNPKEIETDPKIVEYQGNPIRYIPPILEKFKLTIPAIYTLRGPRQVGKSTALKLLIRKLLIEKRINPNSIFFYSADDLETPKDVYHLLCEYQEILNELGHQSEIYYIFIDEITNVSDWQKGVKAFYEEGRLSKTFLLLTGSSALDLRKGAERLPGRRGKDPHPDKVLLPLSFPNFLSVTKFPYLEDLSTLPSFWKILDKPNLAKKLSQLRKIQTYLKRWVSKYQLSGGFPRSVNDLFSLKKISPTTYETYLTWLRGDITKYGRSEHLARQILLEIANLQTSRVEWSTIARKVEVDTHTTIMDYAQLLEDLFILRIIFQLDFHRKRPQPKKRKKIYFLDPLILWCVLGWHEKWGDFFPRVLEKVPKLAPSLAESLVAQHLIRKDIEDWTAPSIFFWHNAKEIDFLTFTKEGEILPIEVKYQERINDADFLLLKKSFKKGIIISKNDLLINGNFIAIPLEFALSTL